MGGALAARTGPRPGRAADRRTCSSHRIAPGSDPDGARRSSKRPATPRWSAYPAICRSPRSGILPNRPVVAHRPFDPAAQRPAKARRRLQALCGVREELVSGSVRVQHAELRLPREVSDRETADDEGQKPSEGVARATAQRALNVGLHEGRKRAGVAVIERSVRPPELRRIKFDPSMEPSRPTTTLSNCRLSRGGRRRARLAHRR